MITPYLNNTLQLSLEGFSELVAQFIIDEEDYLQKLASPEENDQLIVKLSQGLTFQQMLAADQLESNWSAYLCDASYISAISNNLLSQSFIGIDVRKLPICQFLLRANYQAQVEVYKEEKTNFSAIKALKPNLAYADDPLSIAKAVKEGNLIPAERPKKVVSKVLRGLNLADLVYVLDPGLSLSGLGLKLGDEALALLTPVQQKHLAGLKTSYRNLAEIGIELLYRACHLSVQLLAFGQRKLYDNALIADSTVVLGNHWNQQLDALLFWVNYGEKQDFSVASLGISRRDTARYLLAPEFMKIFDLEERNQVMFHFNEAQQLLDISNYSAEEFSKWQPLRNTMNFVVGVTTDSKYFSSAAYLINLAQVRKFEQEKFAAATDVRSLTSEKANKADKAADKSASLTANQTATLDEHLYQRLTGELASDGSEHADLAANASAVAEKNSRSAVKADLTVTNPELELNSGLGELTSGLGFRDNTFTRFAKQATADASPKLASTATGTTPSSKTNLKSSYQARQQALQQKKEQQEFISIEKALNFAKKNYNNKGELDHQSLQKTRSYSLSRLFRLESFLISYPASSFSLARQLKTNFLVTNKPLVATQTSEAGVQGSFIQQISQRNLKKRNALAANYVLYQELHSELLYNFLRQSKTLASNYGSSLDWKLHAFVKLSEWDLDKRAEFLPASFVHLGTELIERTLSVKQIFTQVLENPTIREQDYVLITDAYRQFDGRFFTQLEQVFSALEAESRDPVEASTSSETNLAQDINKVSLANSAANLATSVYQQEQAGVATSYYAPQPEQEVTPQLKQRTITEGLRTEDRVASLASGANSAPSEASSAGKDKVAQGLIQLKPVSLSEVFPYVDRNSSTAKYNNPAQLVPLIVADSYTVNELFQLANKSLIPSWHANRILYPAYVKTNFFTPSQYIESSLFSGVNYGQVLEGDLAALQIQCLNHATKLSIIEREQLQHYLLAEKSLGKANPTVHLDHFHFLPEALWVGLKQAQAAAKASGNLYLPESLTQLFLQKQQQAEQNPLPDYVTSSGMYYALEQILQQRYPDSVPAVIETQDSSDVNKLHPHQRNLAKKVQGSASVTSVVSLMDLPKEVQPYLRKVAQEASIPLEELVTDFLVLNQKSLNQIYTPLASRVLEYLYNSSRRRIKPNCIDPFQEITASLDSEQQDELLLERELAKQENLRVVTPGNRIYLINPTYRFGVEYLKANIWMHTLITQTEDAVIEVSFNPGRLSNYLNYQELVIRTTLEANLFVRQELAAQETELQGLIADIDGSFSSSLAASTRSIARNQRGGGVAVEVSHLSKPRMVLPDGTQIDAFTSASMLVEEQEALAAAQAADAQAALSKAGQTEAGAEQPAEHAESSPNPEVSISNEELVAGNPISNPRKITTRLQSRHSVDLSNFSGSSEQTSHSLTLDPLHDPLTSADAKQQRKQQRQERLAKIAQLSNAQLSQQVSELAAKQRFGDFAFDGYSGLYSPVGGLSRWYEAFLMRPMVLDAREIYHQNLQQNRRTNLSQQAYDNEYKLACNQAIIRWDTRPAKPTGYLIPYLDASLLSFSSDYYHNLVRQQQSLMLHLREFYQLNQQLADLARLDTNSVTLPLEKVKRLYRGKDQLSFNKIPTSFVISKSLIRQSAPLWQAENWHLGNFYDLLNPEQRVAFFLDLLVQESGEFYKQAEKYAYLSQFSTPDIEQLLTESRLIKQQREAQQQAQQEAKPSALAQSIKEIRDLIPTASEEQTLLNLLSKEDSFSFGKEHKDEFFNAEAQGDLAEQDQPELIQAESETVDPETEKRQEVVKNARQLFHRRTSFNGIDLESRFNEAKLAYEVEEVPFEPLTMVGEQKSAPQSISVKPRLVDAETLAESDAESKLSEKAESIKTTSEIFAEAAEAALQAEAELAKREQVADSTPSEAEAISVDSAESAVNPAESLETTSSESSLATAAVNNADATNANDLATQSKDLTLEPLAIEDLAQNANLNSVVSVEQLTSEPVADSTDTPVSSEQSTQDSESDSETTTETKLISKPSSRKKRSWWQSLFGLDKEEQAEDNTFAQQEQETPAVVDATAPASQQAEPEKEAPPSPTMYPGYSYQVSAVYGIDAFEQMALRLNVSSAIKTITSGAQVNASEISPRQEARVEDEFFAPEESTEEILATESSSAVAEPSTSKQAESKTSAVEATPTLAAAKVKPTLASSQAVASAIAQGKAAEQHFAAKVAEHTAQLATLGLEQRARAKAQAAQQGRYTPAQASVDLGCSDYPSQELQGREATAAEEPQSEKLFEILLESGVFQSYPNLKQLVSETGIVFSNRNTPQGINNLKVKVINLDTQFERWEAILEQFKDSNIRSLQRIEAIHGHELTATDVKFNFNQQGFKRDYHRYSIDNEIGTALSHRKALLNVLFDNSVDENDFVLICEDDIVFDGQWQRRLNRILQQVSQAPIDVVNLIHPHLSTDLFHISELVSLGLFLPNKTDFLIRDRLVSILPYQEFIPQSSACYLVRKSVIRRAVSEGRLDRISCLPSDFSRLFGVWHDRIVLSFPTLSMINPKFSSNLPLQRALLRRNQQYQFSTREIIW